MRSRPATLRLAPCLIAAAVCLLLGGGPATASCGSYVHVRTPGQSADPRHDQAPPADSPCAHGKCDRLPPAPPASEPTAPPGGGSHDAVLATVFDLIAPATFGYDNAQVGTLSHVPSVPFHPPRV